MKSYNTLSLEKIAARINIKKRPIVSPPIPQGRPASAVPMLPRFLAPSAPTVPMLPRPQAPSAPTVPMLPRPQAPSAPTVPMLPRPQTPAVPMPPRPQQLPTVVPYNTYTPPLSGSYTLRTNTLFPYNYNRNSLYTLPTNPILQGSYITPKIEGAQPSSYTLPLRSGVNSTPDKGRWSDLIDYGADAAEFASYLWDDDEDDTYVPSMITRRRK